MASYTNLIFLSVFLPLTIILYNIIPQKHRWKILLIASYIFFWSISGKLLVYLLGTTVAMHYLGIWLSSIQNERDSILKDETEKEKKKEIKQQFKIKQRKVVLLGAVVLIGTLIVLKYSSFLGTNINSLLQVLNIPVQIPIPKFLLPIGISFYTLQAFSYLMDVYQGKIKADRNLGRLALFISFFPQIMEGPICRYQDTAEQLYKGERSTYKGLTFGAQRILFGLIKKMVIADRLNPLIASIFDGTYTNFDGGIIAVGMILYTLQLYMDFSGVMDIVIGIGEIFNVKLPENFKQPFFSKSISDFWTRWHITLGAWFRDYIYYPVSLTEKCKKITTWGRNKIGNYYGPLVASTLALFAVWICNGVWHGAAWSYIFFGLYHFTLITLGRLFEPIFKKINTLLHINPKHFLYKGMQIVRTTILVFIGELFFRAKGLRAGLEMFGIMVSKFSFKGIFDGSLLNMKIDLQDFIIVGVMTLIIFIISILKEKGINIRESVSKKNIVIRWILYYALILTLIIFGAYGVNYTPVDPMYAQF